MKSTKAGNTYIIKLEPGDDVIPSLVTFAKEHNIANAYFSGIGAVEYLKCGYYKLSEKKYYFTEYHDLVEVVAMVGNVMLKDGEPFVHVHGVFTGEDNNAFGGHIDQMRVGVTLEIMLTPLSSSLDRQFEDNIGLFLINCGADH